MNKNVSYDARKAKKPSKQLKVHANQILIKYI